MSTSNPAGHRTSAVPAGPPPPPPVPSDVRLKTDIERIGITAHDLPLYSYRYKTGGDPQIGVMAHEVLDVAPDAVSIREDGFYCVDYVKLGLAVVAECNAARVPGTGPV